jgi:hypothetical protein
MSNPVETPDRGGFQMKRNIEPLSSYSNLLRFLFLIAILSLIGCAFPREANRSARTPPPQSEARVISQPSQPPIESRTAKETIKIVIWDLIASVVLQ